MKVSAEELFEAAVARRKIRWARQALHQSKHRAGRRGLPFAITLADIQVPDVCPVSLRRLNYYNTKRDYDSPALERYEPALGWVPGNVFTCSYWISAMKNGRSWSVFEAECEKILAEAISKHFTRQDSAEDELLELRRSLEDLKDGAE